MFSRSSTSLAPPERAAFATSSRLLSCLITESLLNAIFVPGEKHNVAGTAIVLTPEASKGESHYSAEDVFAILPLRHVPIFKPNATTLIGLLDPLDMFPYVFKPAMANEMEHPVQNGKAKVSTALWIISEDNWRICPNSCLWSISTSHG